MAGSVTLAILGGTGARKAKASRCVSPAPVIGSLSARVSASRNESRLVAETLHQLKP
jgi:hypothetical protein